MKTYIKLLFCFLFSACFSTNQDAGAGAPELDTTETALATGAVIGAGVGALVGSTSGDAGAGMVLGGIAGATSGGLIGKSIEGQERRIDQHDAKAGIDTRKKTSNSRGSLSNTLWSNSASPSATSSDSVDNFNRPSGRKGVAAKYVPPIGEENIDLGSSSNTSNEKYVQIRQERKYDNSAPMAPKVVLGANSDLGTSKNSNLINEEPIHRGESLPPAATTSPKIELQKPKAELPAYSAVPMRKPSFENNSSDKYANLPTTSKKSSETIKESSRAKLVETTNTKQPVKTELVKSNTEKVVTESPKVQELPKAVTADDTAVESQAAKAVKAPAKAESAVCDAGGKDYERAKTASSDSDKVFYLRRVILACPKDSSSRIQLGKVYSKLGLKDEAKKEFNSVLEIDPSNESAQDEMSIMMLDSRKN